MTANLDVLGGITDLAAWKNPCAVATTVDMTDDMIGLPVVDGYQTLADDRICVRANTDETTNGIYNAQLSAWTPAIDFAFNSGVVQGTQVLILNGNTYGGAYLTVTTHNPIVVGESLIAWDSFVPNAPVVPLHGPWRAISTGHTDTATSADGTIAWFVLYNGTKVQNIPAANTVPAGFELLIIDYFGDCTVNPIQIVPAANHINGGTTTSYTMGTEPGSSPGMSVRLQSDGNLNWIVLVQ